MWRQRHSGGGGRSWTGGGIATAAGGGGGGSGGGVGACSPIAGRGARSPTASRVSPRGFPGNNHPSLQL